MKKMYLYLITLDNRIKYFISKDNHTYNLHEAKMFSSRSAAQRVADKQNTIWKVGVTYFPESMHHLLINDIKPKTK